MKGLLVIAHGSHHPRSDQEIRALTASICKLENEFDLVQHCYLEIAAPDIVAGLNLLVSGGAKQVVALPYFLARGNHVARDVPDIIRQAALAHPQIEISITEHIGGAPDMPEYILRHLKNHQ